MYTINAAAVHPMKKTKSILNYKFNNCKIVFTHACING